MVTSIMTYRGRLVAKLIYPAGGTITRDQRFRQNIILSSTSGCVRDRRHSPIDERFNGNSCMSVIQPPDCVI